MTKLMAKSKRLNQGDRVVYSGRLTPYIGQTAQVAVYWLQGLCRGRYQIIFEAPVYDVDGVELCEYLTVAPEDIQVL